MSRDFVCAKIRTMTAKKTVSKPEFEFHFPTEGVTIRATSLEEAMKKLKKSTSSPSKK